MELDTGSAVFVISQKKFHEIFGNQPIKPCKIKLRTDFGEKLKSLGVMDVTVEHNGQTQSALGQLYVVEKGTTNLLFGRSWLKEIKIYWQNIKNIMHVSTVKTDGKMKVQSILRKYS